MHLLRVESRSIDGTAEAVDLDQTPADIVALSFTDTDLALLSGAWARARDSLPSVRLASLAALRHPYSVDLYVEKILSRARFVLVRLLGGKDYWSYGVDELAVLARSIGCHLALVPGDEREDPRLDEASTIPVAALRRIRAYFAAGGSENIAACLAFIAGYVSPRPPAPEPCPVRPCGLFAPATRPGPAGALAALIVFYRAWMLAADTAPVEALAEALGRRGFRVAAVYVTSLKDGEAVTSLGALIGADRPDVILNLTGFSARTDAGGSVLDRAGAPVLQLVLSGGGRAQWLESGRGLGPADLAMNVVMPELDGRVLGGAISFKAETPRDESLEFTRLVHAAEPANLAYAADLALAWTALARAPRKARRLACVLSDYPAKAGRTGYAIGLDTPRSVIAILHRLSREGFTVAEPPDETALIAALSEGEAGEGLGLADYRRSLATLPGEFVARVRAAWGEPGEDPAFRDGAFRFRVVRSGNLLIAVQPDRGGAAARKSEYHDPAIPPRHHYVAFYLWLRMIERVHAIIHCGTHGTLEWLPGKAVALSESCAPRAVLGPVPLIYPFIVNNPGEAAQAKRRSAAVTIGHLTPPLVAAGAHGAARELEALFDEYSQAQSLDPRRAAVLAELIIERARETGLATESGMADAADPTDALVRLDAWLCDLKDMRIGDGLHVFGAAPDPDRIAQTADSLATLGDPASLVRLIQSCGEAEMRGLLTALDGGFVEPGPAGAPGRGRIDVLPTGRNLFGIDPRAVPTPTAWEIGRRTADQMLTRHLQDHGDWPKRVVLDIWGSATMRTGGDDLAQALALLGVRPRWDRGSSRVSGFDILPMAVMSRPRVDVTLRISGLFRDVFPHQIELFDAAARAVAGLDEAPGDNPLAASIAAGDAGRRIFGAAPGQYGIGLSRVIGTGGWSERAALGEAYLAQTSHAYGAGGEGIAAPADFRQRVAGADAFLHVQDLPGQDILDADAFAEHEGGFAAAAEALGGNPALYHADTTNPDRSVVRSLREEVARVLRGRAINPRWIAGQMRHGYRGAAEIAETIDNFFAYAALTDVTEDRQFDLLFDATLGDETVRGFLTGANPAAADAIARRFDEAIRRGFWSTRRNSTAEILAELRTVVR
jgi:cobaltochelatase CobN